MRSSWTVECTLLRVERGKIDERVCGERELVRKGTEERGERVWRARVGEKEERELVRKRREC